MTAYIRQANLEDLVEIMQIIASAKDYLAQQKIDQWQNGYPVVSDIEDDIRSSEKEACVLVVNGNIAGYAVIMTSVEPAYQMITDGKWQESDESENYVTIHRMALSTEFRGLGLANIFWSNILSTMRMQGFTDFRVDTHPENKVMRGALEKQGFEYRGNVMFEGLRFAYQLILK
ncbi:GNAT family N-acetyltransferase [Floricoccus penangensis]|uniref:GNAT family N-acetyltransferase n=1 Tax=Floricoccus penangensis TaxID=1859475 RepID=UPI002040C88F|nr:GNAT family N-acetyltransferase [Floricoccus penangensis]URZ87808.1 GNAT family N-acetyltransferase [Floricoccus penangensis]